MSKPLKNFILKKLSIFLHLMTFPEFRNNVKYVLVSGFSFAFKQLFILM